MRSIMAFIMNRLPGHLRWTAYLRPSADNRWNSSSGAYAAILTAVAVSACSSLGPGNLQRDRLDYNDAVSESGKEMLLKNIVRLRYADSPLFLNVSS